MTFGDAFLLSTQGMPIYRKAWKGSSRFLAPVIETKVPDSIIDNCLTIPHAPIESISSSLAFLFTHYLVECFEGKCQFVLGVPMEDIKADDWDIVNFLDL